MRQQLELHDREFSLAENIDRLEAVNQKIKALTVEKEALTDAIIIDIGHEKKGERSYTIGTTQVTCKTPYILSLDKKAYIGGEVYLPEAFDPIEQSISYKVNRAKYDAYIARAPQTVRSALDMLIDDKPGKPSVTIRR